MYYPFGNPTPSKQNKREFQLKYNYDFVQKETSKINSRIR